MQDRKAMAVIQTRHGVDWVSHPIHVFRCILYGFSPDHSGSDFYASAINDSWGIITPADHANFFAVADKYGIPRLYMKIATRYVESLHQFSDLKAQYTAFFQSINAVYTLSPSSNRILRDRARKFHREECHQIEKNRRWISGASWVEGANLSDPPTVCYRSSVGLDTTFVYYCLLYGMWANSSDCWYSGVLWAVWGKHGLLF